MRYRLGHTLRLTVGLLFLVLTIPFLMFKLDPGNHQSTAEESIIDYSDVKIRFSFTIY